MNGAISTISVVVDIVSQNQLLNFLVFVLLDCQKEPVCRNNWSKNFTNLSFKYEIEHFSHFSRHLVENRDKPSAHGAGTQNTTGYIKCVFLSEQKYLFCYSSRIFSTADFSSVKCQISQLLAAIS